MASIASSRTARSLVALAALGLGGAASANDSIAGALLGAGAGAIIGQGVGGPDAALAGGIIGAVTGAAVASSYGAPRVAYGDGYGYAPPPVYYPRRPRAPVYVVPPPPMVYVPSRGHGYWHHGVDAWGHPLRTWVPAPPRMRHYAPAPRPYYPGYGHPRPRW